MSLLGRIFRWFKPEWTEARVTKIEAIKTCLDAGLSVEKRGVYLQRHKSGRFSLLNFNTKGDLFSEHTLMPEQESIAIEMFLRHTEQL